jgi:phosphate transport system permease protein
LVILVDRLANAVITVGGISVVVAVLGILLCLVAVVAPLFGSARLSNPQTTPLASADRVGDLLLLDVGEHRNVALALFRDGRILELDPSTGRTIREDTLPLGGVALTRVAGLPDGRFVAALADGSFRKGRLSFESRILTAAEGAQFGNSAWDERRVVDGALLERTRKGELRSTSVSAKVEPFDLPSASSPVVALDARGDGERLRVAILEEAGRLRVAEIDSSENPFTGEVENRTTSRELFLPAGDDGIPFRLALSPSGDRLFAGWVDGRLARWNLRDLDGGEWAERIDVTRDPGLRLTAIDLLGGGQSLLVADSAGGIGAWFVVEPETGAETGRDRFRLARAHDYGNLGASATALGIGGRGKLFVTGAADGSVTVIQGTSERRVASFRMPGGAAARMVRVAPKGDGIFALGTDGRATLWDFSSPHPEVSWTSLFGEVWYEGYPKPGFTWQSSSASEESEPKLSLVPLIFGTLKATLYALLFAGPIALLAAIYTSEFLDERWRSPTKSLVEMMASLPSVVLGFVAALVLAPLVESSILAILIAFGAAPLLVLGLGYLWQLMPGTPVVRKLTSLQLPILAVALIAAAALSAMLAPVVERVAFSGDFRGWLDGRTGSGAPGVALVTWPILVTILLFLDFRFFAPALSGRLASRTGQLRAAVELVRFLAVVAVSIGLAAVAGRIGAAAGLDPRGTLLGTYVQRNALVVGFVMGFAVIPIVYTLADDALQAVPRSLRSASLGCGATRWQTATRVVLPVAMPGIFSALMVGLGRAVGETMIVLMAAGNTPVMEMNPFSGLRTLSANVAVELPEAVRGGTLYRTLFLSALALFLLTFVLNTLAELVRQRFRRRALQL